MLLTVMLAAASITETPPSDMVRLLGDTAVIYGDDGEAKFIGTPEYIFELADNPERRVRFYDAEHRMVRVSPEGVAGVWLSCREVASTAAFCLPPVTRASPDRRAASRGGRIVDVRPMGAMPACPGDPRCPRIK